LAASPATARSGSILAKTVSVISGGREGSKPWVVLVSRRPAAPAAVAPEPDAQPAQGITVATGNGAISHATWISLAAACCSGLMLYSVKHRTTVMDGEIVRAFHATKAAQNNTAMLKVEWAALNDPTRLQTMAAQYSTLKPLVPSQFVALDDLPKHLPAPGTIIADQVPPVVTAAASVVPGEAAAPVPASAPAETDVVARAVAMTPAPARPATVTAAPAPAPEAKVGVDTTPVQIAAANPPAEAPPSANPQPAENAAPASPYPVEAAAPASAPPVEAAATSSPQPAEAAPRATIPPAEPALQAAIQPVEAALPASPPPAEATPSPHAAASGVAKAPGAPIPNATSPMRRSARPALPPKGQGRAVMLARIRPPVLPGPMMLAAITPPRIRLPAAAAGHAKPDPAHGRGVAAPMLHLAMARPPARHDVTLAEFMAQIDAAKAAAHHAAAPHHIGQARSEPAHNLSLPSPPADVLVARSEPPRTAPPPPAVSASAGDTADHEVAEQPRQEEAAAQPRYQAPAYRYPPYQMPYGSPYSPVYRSPWGPYAWSSRPYYPQPPAQSGYAYQ
jgi:hypothetical protein